MTQVSVAAPASEGNTVGLGFRVRVEGLGV